MLKEKLEKCRTAYEFEFESLCNQFNNLQNEMKVQKDRETDLLHKIFKMEQIISEQNNCIESGGYIMEKFAKDEMPPTE